MKRLFGVMLILPLLLLASSNSLRADDKEKIEAKPAPKTEAKPTTTEQKLFDQVNKERAARGLEPLKLNVDLLRPARASSTVLARNPKSERVIRVVEGEESSTATPAAASDDVKMLRATAWTEGVYPVGPIAATWFEDKDTKSLVLDPNMKEGAIGIVRTSRNEFYYTLLMVGPAKKESGK